MNKQLNNTEFDDFEPALDSAVQAVLAEPLPNDAIQRVKARAAQLECPTIAPSTRGTWRQVWRAPWSRYSGVAAAVVVLAALTIFSLLVERTSLRAFADVIQNIKQADSVQLTMTTRIGRQPEIEGKMYLSGDRLRMEMRMPQSEAKLIKVGDLHQGRALFLDTYRQLAQSLDLDERFSKEFANPIDQLRRAKPEDAEDIGEEYLSRRLTRVFRMRKVDLLGIRGDAEMLVWVNPKDGLPVKIVIRDPELKQEIRFEDFVWDEPIDAELFALDVPNGYQLGKVISLPRPTESARPPAPLPVTRKQLSDGILSRDRVSSRIAHDRPSGPVFRCDPSRFRRDVAGGERVHDRLGAVSSTGRKCSDDGRRGIDRGVGVHLAQWCQLLRRAVARSEALPGLVGDGGRFLDAAVTHSAQEVGRDVHRGEHRDLIAFCEPAGDRVGGPFWIEGSVGGDKNMHLAAFRGTATVIVRSRRHVWRPGHDSVVGWEAPSRRPSRAGARLLIPFRGCPQPGPGRLRAGGTVP